MLYLDTNILIYLFESHDPFSEQVARILEEFTSESKLLATSVVAVTEFLAGTDSSSLATLHKVPNLMIIPLDESLAADAAVLQRKHKIQIGDSLHLATAIHKQAESFFTNDKKLAKVVEKYIPVINL